MHKIGLLALLAGAALVGIGCGDGGAAATTGSGGGGGGTNTGGGDQGGGDQGGGGAAAKPAEKAGIQGCVERFVDDSGVCRPSVTKCGAGEIPVFSEGCLPVGIADCATAFVSDDGLCHAAMSACPAGSFAVPSEGCVPIDGAEGCGEGPWGPIADAPNTIWVDPSYAGDAADGSKDKPVKTIAAALALAPEGGRVALAAGTYDEAIAPTKGVEIVGRCPSMVKVTGTEVVLERPTVVDVAGATGVVALRRLHIAGAGRAILIESGEAVVEQVWVDGAVGAAVVAVGADSELSATHLFIASTQPGDDGTAGLGFSVESGARADVAASAFVDNHLFAIQNVDADLTLKDVLVEGTKSQPSDSTGGYGILQYQSAGKAAKTAVEGAVFTGNKTHAIATVGGELALEGSIVEKTQLTDLTSQKYAIGIRAVEGGKLALKGTVVAGAVGNAVLLEGAGAELTASRCLFADTTEILPQHLRGDAISANDGATATLDESTVIAGVRSGLYAIGGARIEATSCLIESTNPKGATNVGDGVMADNDGELVVTNSAIVRGAGVGAHAFLGTLTLTDSLIEETLADANGAQGLGVWSDHGTTTVTGTLIAKSRAAGIYAVTGSLKLEGSRIIGVVESTLPKGSESFADGVLVSRDNTTAEIVDSLVEGCGRAGILFSEAKGTISGSMVTANRYGLVLQGAAGVTLGEGNAISGNSEMDHVDSGALPVP